MECTLEFVKGVSRVLENPIEIENSSKRKAWKKRLLNEVNFCNVGSYKNQSTQIMLFTTISIFTSIAVLASLGYIISAVFDIKNSNLINVNKTISKFIGKESWISMVSPIYGLMLHFYNVLLWAISSIHQIFKVIDVWEHQ